MHKQTLRTLGELLDSQDAMEHARRAALIIADTASDDAERQIARERAERCERRLVHLDRELRRIGR